LLFTEFGGAVQSTAYSSVLPIVSNSIGGAQLYGATLVAGIFTTILVLALGPGPFARLRPGNSLLLATAGFVVGVALTVGAVSMVMVLAGTIIRGLAGGFLAGFGLTALGALYGDDLRPRVVGLFAVMWLLPSLIGPVANSAITIAFGWRSAMG
jgi:MFS family permease